MKMYIKILIWIMVTGLLSGSPVTAQSRSTNAADTVPIGHIAYIGDDYNVYHLDLEYNQLTQLTDDATLDTETLRFYRWPTWSSDGRLAYFLTSLERDGDSETALSQITTHISHDGLTAGRQAYIAQNADFQYAFWSPRNCSVGEGCRDLAVLLSSKVDGLFLTLLRDGASQTINELTETTIPPFYFSWSPDGTQMLWHRGSDGLTVYDATNRRISEPLTDIPGMFGAPAWSPVDDRLLYGTVGSSAESVNLVIAAMEETTVLVSDLTGPVAFSWSPDGNNVAYIGREGVLFIADTVTGQTIAQSPAADILAFFWSPDSQYITCVTLATSPAFNIQASERFPVSLSQQEHAPISLTWSVLNVKTATTRYYSTFQPTDEMLYLLRFFDQFSQSHRIWSPDSTHIVYSHLMLRNQPVISILDVSQTDSVPFTIASGVNAVWSFE